MLRISLLKSLLRVTGSKVWDICRRRKLYFLVPFLLISLISVIGTFILPKRYESYTTILVKKEGILSPFFEWQKAIALASPDLLLTLNEIIFSRSTLEKLVDSLGIRPEGIGPGAMEKLVADVRRKISVEQRGSDSFRIFFADSDPNTAQRAATILANIYMQTSLGSNQQQIEDIVRFYEEKVDQFRRKFEEEQRSLLTMQQSNLRSIPLEESSLRSMIDKLKNEMNVNERALAQQQQAFNLLKSYRENVDKPSTAAQISTLDAGSSIQYSTELKALAFKYTDLLSRYTPRYPQLRAVRTQLIDLLEKSAEALKVEIANTRSKRSRLDTDWNTTIANLSTSIDTNELGTERRSSYAIMKGLYDTMREKLEAAKISSELGDAGTSKYLVLDPALISSPTTKPKKGLVIGAGSALGFIIGIAAMFAAEYYDPTIRRRQDIEVFKRPIIGYIP